MYVFIKFDKYDWGKSAADFCMLFTVTVKLVPIGLGKGSTKEHSLNNFSRVPMNDVKFDPKIYCQEHW